MFILFYSNNRNAHSNARYQAGKPLGFLRRVWPFAFPRQRLKRSARRAWIFMIPWTCWRWNVIYEGPLHASFINVYVITRRRTPRNDIFPRFYVGIQLHRRVVSIQRNRYLPWTNVSSLRVIDVTRGRERERDIGLDLFSLSNLK